MILTRNSNFCTTQPFLVGLYNGNWECLLWDRSWYYMVVPTATCPTANYGILTKLTPPTRSQIPLADAIKVLWVKAPESHPTYLLPPSSQPRQDKCFCMQNPIYSYRISLSQPSDPISVHIWLKRPRDFYLGFLQVSTLSSLFGLLAWLPWSRDSAVFPMCHNFWGSVSGSYTGLARPRWATKMEATFWPPSTHWMEPDVAKVCAWQDAHTKPACGVHSATEDMIMWLHCGKSWPDYSSRYGGRLPWRHDVNGNCGVMMGIHGALFIWCVI